MGAESTFDDRSALSEQGAAHLRKMTRIGLAILQEQPRSHHARGFAQDVWAEDGTLIHADLTDDGIWKLEDANTGEFQGLFGVR